MISRRLLRLRLAAALPLVAATVLGATALHAPMTVVTAAHATGGDCSRDAALLDFSDALDKTTFEGTPVAGLSALAPTRHGRALAVVDRIGSTPARMYDLDLDDAEVKGVTVLRRADGTPYTGDDFDGEGLVVEGRTVLITSETEPTIRRFRRGDGRQVGALPVPARFQVAPAGQATVNQTFEALTADGDTVFAGMEGALAPDGAGNNRILRYDRGVPTAQYAYRTDPALNLVELVALGGDQLLSLERGFKAGVGNTIRVFMVSTTGAPDVSGTESLSTVTDPRTFLGKQLLFDLADCPPSGATAKAPQPNPLLDNVEGMALGQRLRGGRTELHLLSDDNGAATQTTRLYRLAVKLRPQARLEARAFIPATAYQPGPVSGTQLPPTTVNGVTPPFPGQPIPGFSAIIKAGGNRLLAMPDNGFGAKTNSADFLLRAYTIEPDYRKHTVKIHGFLSFRDPDRRLPFPIVNENTPDRLLTGADLDIESLARDARGDLWIGEEFGPYLVRTDRTGKVLQAPIPLPDGGKSPQSPDLKPGEQPTIRGSRGFEAMATSENGRTLYPILEGARIDDPDQRRRIVYEFDVRSAKYTGRTWSFRVDTPDLVVGDAAVLDGQKLILIERDNAEGVDARVKRLVVTDLSAGPQLPRRTALDLLRIPDPRGVSSPPRPGEYGVGPLFSFPMQSVETVLPLHGDKVLVANDNNFPGNDGRILGKADDTELIVITIPGL